MEVGLKKLNKLKKILKGMDSVVIAYSGGVDSTFLLKVALDILGKEKILAVTARSQTYTKKEYQYAKIQARKIKAPHMTIYTDELKDKKFVSNPSRRCYFCKRHLFGSLSKLAKDKHFSYVLDATNSDDEKDFRPGREAGLELGIKSPLKEAGLKKSEIRQFSKKLGLDTWDKPAMACLASRFPYGSEIKLESLLAIEQAEDDLRKLGFSQVRVRCYGRTARIEIAKKDIKRLINSNLRDKITRRLKKLGFIYITLDLEGYRSGSMNEELAA